MCRSVRQFDCEKSTRRLIEVIFWFINSVRKSRGISVVEKWFKLIVVIKWSVWRNLFIDWVCVSWMSAWRCSAKWIISKIKKQLWVFGSATKYKKSASSILLINLHPLHWRNCEKFIAFPPPPPRQQYHRKINGKKTRPTIQLHHSISC